MPLVPLLADLVSLLASRLTNLRCGLVVSYSVASDPASRRRPYSVLLVLSRFNNAGLSPAVMGVPRRTSQAVYCLEYVRRMSPSRRDGLIYHWPPMGPHFAYQDPRSHIIS